MRARESSPVSLRRGKIERRRGESLADVLLERSVFRRWQFWLGLLVSAAFLWVALRGLKIEEVFGILRAADYAWLIPGAAIYFVAVAARTWRWQALLKPLKAVSIRRLFPVVAIGYMGNNVYPARIGELLRAYVLKRGEHISIKIGRAHV